MANKKTGKKTSAKDKKNKLKKTTIKSTSKKKNGKKISIMVKKKTTNKTSPKKKPIAKTKKTVKKQVTKKEDVKKITTTKIKKTAFKKAITKKPEIYYEDVDVKAAARAVAIKKIKGYSKKDLAHFKKIIIDKRDEIITQLQNLKEQMMDTSTGEYINENSPYSLHMAEQGTDAMEREKTFLYAQRETKFLGYLETALKRIDAGTYGICIECIEKPKHLCETCPLVPVKRLEAVPHSQVCVSIKQKQEKK